MAMIEIGFNQYIDLRDGSIKKIDGIGSWAALIDLVKNRNNKIYLSTDFEGPQAILYFDLENNEIKARLLENT